MICPNCFNQMHQKDKEGGGKMDDAAGYYETWEIKICPVCGTECKEFYSCQITKRPEDKK